MNNNETFKSLMDKIASLEVENLNLKDQNERMRSHMSELGNAWETIQRILNSYIG